MTLSNTPGQIKKFKRTPWRFQATFGTPLEELDSFVATILADEEFESGSVTIDEIVFEPKNLNAFLAAHSLAPNPGRDTSITAPTGTQARELLKATLSDWVDFTFVPTPKPFVIYADHDEFTTFFASSKANLNRVAQPLLDAGFEQITDYQRDL